jgi:hypothetical protein
MKAIERIGWLAYGNHSMSSETRSDGELVLTYLQNNGCVPRAELAKNTGFGSDIESLNKVLQPLKGDKQSNPLDLSFVQRIEVDGTVYYKLSREAFDASMKALKTELVAFLDREAIPAGEHRQMEQLMRLCFSNHQSAYEYREKAPTVIRTLVKQGETEKSELMTMLGLDYSTETENRQFRRMMQYLRGSWNVDDEQKNPLHTESHSFVIRLRSDGNTAYYRIDTREFRRSLNVVIKSIRDFLTDDAFVEHQLTY